MVKLGLLVMLIAVVIRIVAINSVVAWIVFTGGVVLWVVGFLAFIGFINFNKPRKN